MKGNNNGGLLFGRYPFLGTLWSALQSACSMWLRLLDPWTGRPAVQRFASCQSSASCFKHRASLLLLLLSLGQGDCSWSCALHVPLTACAEDGCGCVAQEGEECSVIFTWGRGREGQLGLGMHIDSAIPAAVDELRGRHVLQVGHNTPLFFTGGKCSNILVLVVLCMTWKACALTFIVLAGAEATFLQEQTP